MLLAVFKVEELALVVAEVFWLASGRRIVGVKQLACGLAVSIPTFVVHLHIECPQQIDVGEAPRSAKASTPSNYCKRCMMAPICARATTAVLLLDVHSNVDGSGLLFTGCA